MTCYGAILGVSSGRCKVFRGLYLDNRLEMDGHALAAVTATPFVPGVYLESLLYKHTGISFLATLAFVIVLSFYHHSCYGKVNTRNALETGGCGCG